jgi:hypothetical protein
MSEFMGLILGSYEAKVFEQLKFFFKLKNCLNNQNFERAKGLELEEPHCTA